MLAIRMQRKGRKGLALYRIVVQDARRHPLSGAVVAEVGTYDPHTKKTVLNKEKTEFYLKNGAQPSSRVVKVLLDNKVTLPKWVAKPTKKKGQPKNPDKFAKPEGAEASAPAEAPAEVAPAEPTEPEATEPEAAEPETPDTETPAPEAEA